MSLADLDLSFNPFADDDGNINYNDERTPNGKPNFASAFLPSLNAATHRRRSSVSNTDIPPGSSRKRHIRTRTEINIDIGNNTASLHPLKSAALKTASFTDFGITRPHLSRIVNGTLVDVSDNGDADSLVSSSSEPEETDVLIHEVTSQDSLAGVALKYGIPLAELRRANHLWTTDSIHLHKTLYIPVEQASRVQDYIKHRLAALPSQTPQGIENSLSSLLHPAFPNDIRRIPASQLSYFPPSSDPNKSYPGSAEASPTSNGTYPSPHLKVSQLAGRHAPSPAHSLNSILTAFPIAASTRDEIITRLSFDSASSSYTDMSRSHTGSDQETGHELDDVNKPSRPSIYVEHDVSAAFFSSVTPKVSQTGPNPPIPNQSKQKIGSSSSQTQYSHAVTSNSPPSSYVPQINNSYVRTVQLEPSAAMQLPDMRNHPIGRSSSITKNSVKRETDPMGTVGRQNPRSKVQVTNVNFGIEMDSQK